MEFNNTVIDINSWHADETYDGVYNKGARVKSHYFSPKDPLINCIKPGHRYLFKLSKKWCPWQFWMEIIAYRIGCLMDVKVPPAHIGFSREIDKEIYGALIEWFYTEPEQYVDGSLIMKEIIEDYDDEKGKQHNLTSILSNFDNNELLIKNWAKILTFDSVIGNTDRHQDNWGFILRKVQGQEERRAIFSPAFDNGTALAYGTLEEKFYLFDDENYVKTYLKRPRRAKHHMKWSLDDDRHLNFFDFMAKFVEQFPQTGDIISNLLRFTRHEAEIILEDLVDSVDDSRYCLTLERLNFTLDLVMKRKEILKSTLKL